MLDELRVGTAREQESSACVPEIVPAYVEQPRSAKQVAAHRGHPVRVAVEGADPNLTLTHMQYPAMVSKAGSRKPSSYAEFANPCNAQKRPTAHS